MRRWVFIGLLLIAGAYFFYEARGVIFAPTLKIFTPEEIATVSEGKISIAGQTNPYLKVIVAGKEAQADENGFFSAEILLWPGYNEIGVSVRDKFGSETRKVLKIFLR